MHKQNIKDNENHDIIGMLIRVSTILLIASYLCSCTNGRVYVGYESVDTIKRSEETKKADSSNWACLFVSCNKEN